MHEYLYNKIKIKNCLTWWNIVSVCSKYAEYAGECWQVHFITHYIIYPLKSMDYDIFDLILKMKCETKTKKQLDQKHFLLQCLIVTLWRYEIPYFRFEYVNLSCNDIQFLLISLPKKYLCHVNFTQKCIVCWGKVLFREIFAITLITKNENNCEFLTESLMGTERK